MRSADTRRLQVTAKTLLGENINPYSRAGVNAELLTHLLTLLEP